MNDNTTKKFFVAGATGDTGGEAVRLLLKKGYQVRALARKEDDRSRKLQELGAEVVYGDLQNLDDVSRVLQGIHRAYFVYPISPGLVQATVIFAQAAKEAGVEAIVNMSQISARREAPSNASREHWLAERVLDWSGITVSHLRSNFFAEWLTYPANAANIRQGVHASFLDPEARHAAVTAEDQARVIVAILENPQAHKGQIYVLSGPKEYTQPETAELLSSVLGRKIGYKFIEYDTWVEAVKQRGRGSTARGDSNSAAGSGYGGTDHFFQHLGAVAKDHKNGLFSGTNDNIIRITGQQPTTLEEFILRNKAAFQ